MFAGEEHILCDFWFDNLVIWDCNFNIHFNSHNFLGPMVLRRIIVYARG